MRRLVGPARLLSSVTMLSLSNSIACAKKAPSAKARQSARFARGAVDGYMKSRRTTWREQVKTEDPETILQDLITDGLHLIEALRKDRTQPLDVDGIFRRAKGNFEAER